MSSNSDLSGNISKDFPNENNVPNEIEKSSNKIVMGGYNAYSTFTSTTQPGIVTSIQKFEIEVEVIARAVEIFYRINKLKINDNRGGSMEVPKRNKSVKGSRKIRLIFYCIFMAYSELEIPVDPAYAADIVHLPRREIEQALNEFGPSGTTLIEPEKLIKFYIKRINDLIVSTGISYNVELIDKEVRRVIEVCKSTPAGKEWIQNTAAKLVAIAALYFYMNDIKGFETVRDVNIFEQACYLSWACIRRYHGEVIKYYNYDPNEQIKKPKVSLAFLL